MLPFTIFVLFTALILFMVKRMIFGPQRLLSMIFGFALSIGYFLVMSEVRAGNRDSLTANVGSALVLLAAIVGLVVLGTSLVHEWRRLRNTPKPRRDAGEI